MSLSLAHKPANFPQTGMPLGMRYFRSSSLRISEFPYATPEPHKVRWLASLTTDEADRGKGQATKLMRRVCGEADRHATALILEPRPFGLHGMDRNMLEVFYTRLGFARIQDEPCVMSRMPRQ